MIYHEVISDGQNRLYIDTVRQIIVAERSIICLHAALKHIY